MASSITRSEQGWAVLGSSALAVLAIVWSWSHHAFLLYGDSEAHTHIARRLFDSHRPGLGQLGSVWLPLPHLLLAPFVAVDAWWRSGFAGAIPSALCYVLACVGLYRLGRRWMDPLPATLALLFFALNANLLYLATTAMSEPLFLCELIWAVELLVGWHVQLDEAEGQNARLWVVIAVLVAAVWTRYDGWILAFLAWVVMAVLLYRRGRLVQRHFIAASVVLLAAPVSWMVYNQVLFGDWLDFMRGPYSARAIEERTANGAIPPHPGWHNAWVSLLFFGKTAELDAVAQGWGWALWLPALVAMDWAWRRRAEKSGSTSSPLWTLLLWLPMPFYAYSVAWGSVPIFLPVWWPHSYYNLRYGMELLPALALFLGFFEQAGTMKHRHPRFDRVAMVVLFLAVLANAATLLMERPQVFVEGEKNNQARQPYNRILSAALATLHEARPSSLVLMDTSDFPSIVPRAGLTYRQTLNESDKEFYQEALADPSNHAGIILAFAGDTVAQAVAAHPAGLRLCHHFQSNGQPDAALYVTDDFPDAGCDKPGSRSQEGRW